MRYYVFLVLLIATCLSTVAQPSGRARSTELDSLVQLLKRNPLKDTLRVKRLTDYANLCFYDLDFLSGLQALNEARSVSKEIKYWRGEGFCLRSLAVFHRSRPDVSGYYQTRADWILNQCTNLNAFGEWQLKHGERDHETKTIMAKLEVALDFFETKDKETAASIHWEFVQQHQDYQMTSDIQENEVYVEHAKKALDHVGIVPGWIIIFP